MAVKDKFDDAPDIPAYYHLWVGREFDLDMQRNILLHFLADRGLNEAFMKYLDYHFPENAEGYRFRRGT